MARGASRSKDHLAHECQHLRLRPHSVRRVALYQAANQEALVVVQVLRRHVELKVRGPSEELLEGHSRFEPRVALRGRGECPTRSRDGGAGRHGLGRPHRRSRRQTHRGSPRARAAPAEPRRGARRRRVACPGSPGGSGPEREGRSTTSSTNVSTSAGSALSRS